MQIRHPIMAVEQVGINSRDLVPVIADARRTVVVSLEHLKDIRGGHHLGNPLLGRGEPGRAAGNTVT